MMNPVMQQLQAEAQRRFGGLGASSSGVSAPVANSPSTANPMAARALLTGQHSPATPQSATPMTPAMPSSPGVGNSTMPQPGNPQAGAISAMNGSMPGASKHIENALIKRMHAYPPG